MKDTAMTYAVDGLADLLGMTTVRRHPTCELLTGASDEITRLRQWVDDLQSGMYVNCVYCGHRYGPGDTTPVSMADALKEHVEQCPKHPMSRLRSHADALADALDGVCQDWSFSQEAVNALESYRQSRGATEMKDGGPAFQVDTPGTSHYGLVCVNLRDYFAAKAMQGIFTHPDATQWDFADIAADAYRVADAMLKAREKDDG